MAVTVLFGVKAENVDEALPWVEAATGWVGEARENDVLGGDYYRFPPFDPAADDDEPEMILVFNRDPYDGETVFDTPEEWEVALSVDNVEPDADVLKALEADTEHFTRLS